MDDLKNNTKFTYCQYATTVREHIYMQSNEGGVDLQITDACNPIHI